MGVGSGANMGVGAGAGAGVLGGNNGVLAAGVSYG